MAHEQCIVCKKPTLDEFLKIYESEKIVLCDEHTDYNKAQVFCLSCKSLFYIDPVFLSILTQNPSLADEDVAKGVIAITDHSCLSCKKKSDKDSNVYSFRMKKSS